MYIHAARQTRLLHRDAASSIWAEVSSFSVWAEVVTLIVLAEVSTLSVWAEVSTLSVWAEGSLYFLSVHTFIPCHTVHEKHCKVMN